MFNRNGAMGLQLRCIERNDDYSVGDDIIDLEDKLLFFNANIFITSVQHGLGRKNAVDS